MSWRAALGLGGARVADLVDSLTNPPPVDVNALAPRAPAGHVDLPLVCVGLADGVRASAEVDRVWLADVDRRRTAHRDQVIAAGRAEDLEASLHVALLVATERFDPADDADEDAHVASGARLWLLAGAVVSALSGTEPDPFEPWGRLVVAGWWPIGPSGGRLVVSAAG